MGVPEIREGTRWVLRGYPRERYLGGTRIREGPGGYSGGTQRRSTMGVLRGYPKREGPGGYSGGTQGRGTMAGEGEGRGPSGYSGEKYLWGTSGVSKKKGTRYSGRYPGEGYHCRGGRGTSGYLGGTRGAYISDI